MPTSGPGLGHVTSYPDRIRVVVTLATRTAAEQRWSSDLLQRFASTPDTYAAIIEAIDADTQAAATGAEMRKRGGGLVYILGEVREVLLRFGHKHERFESL
jgi:hypothetical protein